MSKPDMTGNVNVAQDEIRKVLQDRNESVLTGVRDNHFVTAKLYTDQRRNFVIILDKLNFFELVIPAPCENARAPMAADSAHLKNIRTGQDRIQYSLQIMHRRGDCPVWAFAIFCAPNTGGGIHAAVVFCSCGDGANLSGRKRRARGGSVCSQGANQGFYGTFASVRPVRFP
jgi:hypothetical protein